jgi:hypothetical protein
VTISGTAIFGPVYKTSFRGLGRWRLDSTQADWYATTTFLTGPLVLTSGGTSLFTHCDGLSCALSEIDVAGYEHHRVALPAGYHRGRPSLHNGRWIAGAVNGVRSFELPGRMVASKGWVTEHGSLAGDRRAR